MIKPLRSAALLLLAATVAATAAPTATYTQTNVLETINLQLTIYQQGPVVNSGKKVTDQVTAFSTRNLIADIEEATGINFGSDAKLVQSTVYSNVTVATGPAIYSTVLSTNLALATNGYLNVGGAELYGAPQGGNVGDVVISNNTFLTNYSHTLASDVVSTVGGAVTNTVTIDTNAGLTTLTPTTDSDGYVTNVLVVSQSLVSPAPTTNFLASVSSSVDVLYGGSANLLYPVGQYLILSTNSPEIVVETGADLGATNSASGGYVASQTGFSISNMVVNFTTNGPTNLYITLQGFVKKEGLKVDVLSGHGKNAVVEDIYGANSTWTVIGSGFTGGTYSTNSSDGAFIQYLGLYLTNGSPVVVNGSVNVGFLKNLPQ